jgi:DNA-binding IclR family transcriptional regulator
LDETVMLMVRSGKLVVCLDLKETNKPIRLNMQIGTIIPLYAGASSKVLLAYQSNGFIDDYLSKVTIDKVAPNTITSKRKLLADLKKIRRQGYSIANQEVNPNVAGIASPVFNATGDIVDSIVVAGPSDRLIPRQKKYVSAIVESAREASRDLGFKKRDI